MPRKQLTVKSSPSLRSFLDAGLLRKICVETVKILGEAATAMLYPYTFQHQQRSMTGIVNPLPSAYNFQSTQPLQRRDKPDLN